ncbi:hypothetical protein JCM8208_006727 [Rhodotorula glutinis]
MSYNNIGLATPRGSGTSGHIQANRSSIRPRQNQREAAPDFKSSFAHRAPDQGILDHERKRKVEAQCFELQVSLEDDGVAPDEVEKQVDALRQRLLAAGAPAASATGIKSHQRHELAAAKQADDERMRRALGIRADHTEGAAFDRDLQQRLKEERIAERERGREERARIEADLRADRAKAQAARDARPPPAPPAAAAAPRGGLDDRSYRDLDRGAGSGSRSGSARLPYGASTSRGRSPSREHEMRPPPRRYDSRSPSRSRSRSPSRSRSRSPPARRRGRSPSRSRSRSRSRSPRRRADSRSRSRSRSLSRSRSPPRRRVKRDDSRSRSLSMSMSRSPSPPRRRVDGDGGRSPSPPRRRSASPPARRARD